MRSVHAVQQAMVRMLYDPAFVDAVHAGSVPGLTEAERALLLQVDRRAWSTDRYRRHRAVHALIDEYPASAACLGVRGVDRFFSSDAFARCLSDRGSMALDFGRWATGELGELAALEQAIAAARRAEPRPGDGALATRPGVEPIVVDRAVLAAFSAIRQRLGASPVETLSRGWTPVSPPSPTGAREPLLVERSEDGQVGLGGGSPALVALLRFACTRRSHDAVVAEAVSLGCDADEAGELVEDLLSEGLLQRG